MWSGPGRVQNLRSGVEDVFGKVPPGLALPKMNIFRLGMLKEIIPMAFRIRLRARANGKGLGAFLKSSPARCEGLRSRIASTGSGVALARMYELEIQPHVITACRFHRGP